ncbi:MAG TPA: hypothetical protein VLE23_14815 [Geminicoccaceae bacterium]|nr:hypothetical protein [Geminicoccaceae bacterium]
MSAVLLASPAWSAEQGQSLADVPVAMLTVVDPETYAAASAMAAGGSTPVDIALGVVGAFEGKTQHIIQDNAGSEAPTSARVTVIREGLLDDAIRGERWDVALIRTPAGIWTISEVKKAWRCRRGEHPDEFGTVLCP